MSIEEFRQWIAYTALEPWGDDRADWRAAHSNALMAGIWGASKKKTEVKDFLLQFKRKTVPEVNKGPDVNRWNALLLQSMFSASAKKG